MVRMKARETRKQKILRRHFKPRQQQQPVLARIVAEQTKLMTEMTKLVKEMMRQRAPLEPATDAKPKGGACKEKHGCSEGGPPGMKHLENSCKSCEFVCEPIGDVIGGVRF